MRKLATQIVMLQRGRITAFGGVKVLTGSRNIVIDVQTASARRRRSCTDR